MKYYEVKFSISAPDGVMQDVCDLVVALAGEAGFESFDVSDEGSLTGYVQQNLFSDELLHEQLALMPYPDVHVDYCVSETEDKDWNEQWEQAGFEPIVVADQVVIHDGRHLPNNSQSSIISYQLSIEIDARQAFGTGNHATTRMMIAHLLQLDLRNGRLLDCGTGTGILAIAALRLGAREAVGYDIDEWSVDNARHNAVINRVDDRFRSLLGNAGQVIPTLDGTFDVVTANINRNILLADMPLFVGRLAPGGHLLLSGFYRDDLPLLLDSASSLGLRLVSQTTDGDWQSCCLQRPL